MGMIGKTSSNYHWGDLSLGDRTAVAKHIGRIGHEIEALIEKKGCISYNSTSYI